MTDSPSSGNTRKIPQERLVRTDADLAPRSSRKPPPAQGNSTDACANLRIDVQILDPHASVGEAEIASAVREACRLAGAREGWVEISVVDDERIQELNRQHLQHDYPTDVLSFCYLWDPDGGQLEGELIISSTTADRLAAAEGSLAADELLWYAVHGALHLCGYEDDQPVAWQRMRAAEAVVLQRLGLSRPAGFDEPRREWVDR